MYLVRGTRPRSLSTLERTLGGSVMDKRTRFMCVINTHGIMSILLGGPKVFRHEYMNIRIYDDILS